MTKLSLYTFEQTNLEMKYIKFIKFALEIQVKSIVLNNNFQWKICNN